MTFRYFCLISNKKTNRNGMIIKSYYLGDTAKRKSYFAHFPQ